MGKTTPPTSSTARTAADFLLSAETSEGKSKSVNTGRPEKIRSKRLKNMINLSQSEHFLGNPKVPYPEDPFTGLDLLFRDLLNSKVFALPACIFLRKLNIIQGI
jgi:hypothetical protein